MKKVLTAVVLLLSSVFLANAQTGNWSGKLDVQGTSLTIVFHLDGDEPTLDSPDQAAQGIPVQIERTAVGGITIQVPSLGASYEGLWTGKQILGTFKQGGLSFPLVLMPEAKLNRPQNPVGPFPYAEEEVTFTNGEAKLAGTLVLPEGYTRKTPVLIMVTGSGQEDRNLVKTAYSLTYGARNLRRTIQKQIEDELAARLVEARGAQVREISLSAADGKVQIELK